MSDTARNIVIIISLSLDSITKFYHQIRILINKKFNYVISIINYIIKIIDKDTSTFTHLKISISYLSQTYRTQWFFKFCFLKILRYCSIIFQRIKMSRIISSKLTNSWISFLIIYMLFLNNLLSASSDIIQSFFRKFELV